LLADKEPEKFDRAAVRWHVRFVYDSKNVGLGESLAVLALFAAIPETVSRPRRLRNSSAAGGGWSVRARHL
jgi:hypothetical protein